MIQNNTKTTARVTVSRPLVAHALGMLLGLGLVAGCGDDGGDPIFEDDAGADAAIDASDTTTDTESTGTSTAGSSTATNDSVSVSPSSTGENSSEIDSSSEAVTDDSTSVTDSTLTDISSTTADNSSSDVTSSTDSTSEVTSSTDTAQTSTDDSTVDTSDVDAGDGGTTDTTEPDTGVTSDTSSEDASAPDASSSDDSDPTEVDATAPTDPTETTDEDAGDAGAPIMLTGIGPIIPDPAVDLAISGPVEGDASAGDGIDDAVFTATITAPISKLVLVNTDEEGNPYFVETGGGGGYYSYWTSSNPIPADVPDITAPTLYNVHTLINGTNEPLPLPVLGSTDEVTLDLYVSFGENPLRTDYYRLYVFGTGDALTQIVDFAPDQDAN